MVKLTEALVLARSRATDLENVRKFNCWGNDLNDIRIIRRMPNVQVLSLSVNKIHTLADFAHCKNLEELYIRKNDITDLNEVCYLKPIQNLRILWLADNPCASEDNYRMTVLKNLPNLQKLDNVAVQEDEVNAAIEQGHDLVQPLLPCESLDLRPLGNVLPKPSLPEQNKSPSIVSTSMPAFSILSKRRDKDSGVGAGGDVQGPESTETRQQQGAVGGASSSEDKKSEPESSSEENPDTLSWEETNKIRVQLGLKPLPVEKVTPMKPRSCVHSAKARNANILQAALHIIKELDAESLEVLADAVHNRLESL